MTTRPPLDAPLSPAWAFVVQLREGTGLTPEAMRGRVEHILSGQTTLFTSLEEFGYCWRTFIIVLNNLFKVLKSSGYDEHCYEG